MPKVNIKFTLPDEQHEYSLCIKAQAFSSAIDETKQEIKNICKHNVYNYSEKELELFENFKENFYTILRNNNIWE